MPRSRHILSAALLSAAAFAQTPCWETAFGFNLGLGDDQYSSPQQLGFQFTYAGVPYTDVLICSNGYIWFGPTAPNGLGPDYSPTEAELLTQGPRLAPLWNDFNPAAVGSGNVWFNSFPASGSNPARAVITWDNVYEYGRTTPLSMQVQLLDNNEIIIHYDSNMSMVLGGFGSNPHVVGVSPGNNATPNPVDFANLPILTAGNPTLHQTIQRGAFPLVGRDLHFMLDGIGGFIVLGRTACQPGAFRTYGYGCPKNMSNYEIFDQATGPGSFDLANTSMHFARTPQGGYTVTAGTGFDTTYSNAVVMADDTILVAQPLGFSFPYAGGTHTAVDLSSNGMLYMASTTTHNAVNGYPTPADLLDDPAPIIAFLWQDLDLSTAGQAYWDTTPGYAMFTIIGAPYWGQGGSNDAQVKLWANGDIDMAWGNAASVQGGPCMVGISEGNGAANLGPVDWSASLPLAVNPAGTVPVGLDAQAGSRPSLNTTFTMDVSDIPAGTPFGIMLLSFRQQNINAAIYGMTGCWQLTNLDAKLLFLTPSPVVPFALPIPNNTGLLGLVIYSQAATFSSGYNPLGVVASNGGEIRLGL
ncbi:MAG: hypothetical protein Fur0037_03800 [Planctomycetota bacterium]